MKISYVLPAYWPAIGGCELHTHELVGRLSERHEIKVITQITSQEDKPDDRWIGTLTRPTSRKERYCDGKAQVIPVALTGGGLDVCSVLSRATTIELPRSR